MYKVKTTFSEFVPVFRGNRAPGKEFLEQTGTKLTGQQVRASGKNFFPVGYFPKIVEQAFYYIYLSKNK
jgi:hypothetical protein